MLKNIENVAKISPFMCREKSCFSKCKSFLIFQKWTKINVQNLIIKILLLTKKFDLIKKNYRHK